MELAVNFETNENFKSAVSAKYATSCRFHIGNKFHSVANATCESARNLKIAKKCEKEMVSFMIAIYCKGAHKNRQAMKGELCPECEELKNYARARSEKCPFMETKTFCANYKVHCYKPEMREKIRAVMRYAGPRMMFHCPIQAVRHLITRMW